MHQHGLPPVSSIGPGPGQGPQTTAPLPSGVGLSSPPPVQQVQADTKSPPPGRPDLTARFRGWYPRWWLLSALGCAVLIGLWSLTSTLYCNNLTANTPFCQFNSVSDWRQGVIVAVVWLLFLMGWLVAFTLGVGPIELRRDTSPLTRFFDALSQYRSVYLIIYVIGIFALCLIIVSWALNRFQPLTFSLYTIVMFVATSCFFHQRSPEERRGWIVGYGIAALFGIGLMFLWPRIFGVSRFQPVILTTEIIIVLIAVVALVRSFVNAARGGAGKQQSQSTASPSGPEEAFVQDLYALTRPGAIWKELFQGLLRKK